jgi:hypothetical protein
MPKITTATTLQNQIIAAYPGINRNHAKRVAYRTCRQADFAEFAAKFNAAHEAYTRGNADETGEQAVNNVLIEYLRKYGSLTAPPSNHLQSVNRTDPTETLAKTLERAA